MRWTGGSDAPKESLWKQPLGSTGGAIRYVSSYWLAMTMDSKYDHGAMTLAKQQTGMQTEVSKSKFKAHALEIFRHVERGRIALAMNLDEWQRCRPPKAGSAGFTYLHA
jgi:hypothetical protein